MQRSTILTAGVVAVVTLVAGVVIGRAVSDPADAPSDATPVGEQPSVVADEAARHLLAPEFVGDPGAFDGRLEAGDVAAPPERTVALLEPIRLDDPDVVDPTFLDPAGGFVAAGVVGVTPTPGAEEPPSEIASVVEVLDAPEPDPASPDTTVPTDADTAPEADPIEVEPIADDPPDPNGSEPAAAAVPAVVLPDLGVWAEIPPITFDPCAGPVPGGAECGGGIAGTIFALSAPPPLDVSVTPGVAATPRVPGGVVCPAGTPEPTDDQVGFTIWSTAPLASADVDIRPVGTSLTPVELTVSTSPDVRDEWQRRFDAADEYDVSWGLVPTCVAVDPEADGTQEVSGIAVDTFDRLAMIPTTPVPADVGGRPPTETRIDGVSPTAHVRAWTTSEGSVAFRTRALGGGIFDEDDLDCATANPVSESRVFPSNRPNPDIYDPDFSRSFFTQIPFHTGGRLLVCVEIYDTDNPLMPLVVERHLFEAPMQPRPEVYLASIDTRGDGDAIDELSWQTGAGAGGAASPGCDRWFTTPSVDDDTLVAVDRALWECPGAQTSLTPAGTFNLPLQVLRDGVPIIDVAVPIDANDCTVERCPQRTDYFRLPIAARGELVCWRGVEEVCPGELEVDAVALVAVRYPLLAGRGGLDGRVVPLDEVDVGVLADEPRVTRPTMTVTEAGEFNRWDATFRFQTDRPVRAAIEPFELVGGTCFESDRSEFTTGFDTEFQLAAPGLCAGRAYGLYVHLIDEAGNEWRIDPGGGYTPPSPPAATFSVQLDFVSDGAGSDELLIEPTPYLAADRRDGRREMLLAPNGCIGTSGTYVEVDRGIRLRADTEVLRVRVELPNVRYTDDFADCAQLQLEQRRLAECGEVERGSDEYVDRCVVGPSRADWRGLVRPVPWSFTVSIPIDEVLDAGTSGSVTATTGFNGAGVAMRFTLQRTSAWVD